MNDIPLHEPPLPASSSLIPRISLWPIEKQVCLLSTNYKEEIFSVIHNKEKAKAGITVHRIVVSTKKKYVTQWWKKTHTGYASTSKSHCSIVSFQQTVTSDFGNSSTLEKSENLHYIGQKRQDSVNGNGLEGIYFFSYYPKK